jgi:hypothetical protein
MHKMFMSFILLLAGGLCFPQQNFKIIGRVPPSDSSHYYRIQVGAFKMPLNAERALARLQKSGFVPQYEYHRDFIRVFLGGINPWEIPAILQHIESLGFKEVWLTEDRNPPPEPIPEDPFEDEIEPEESETPPDEDVFYVPKDEERFIEIDEDTRATPGTMGLAEYKTEPTYTLAYRFVNPNESRGASGVTGGIDILGKGKNDTWMWTTYYQGGFFYDLNGVQQAMTNGIQRSENGVELTVDPSFVYIDGTPYLQLRHRLKNTSTVTVTDQRFGAGADIMIHTNDHASIIMDDKCLFMADSDDPDIENLNLIFAGNADNPVSTLWIGLWERGEHLKHIYDDGAAAAYDDGADSAMAFSFQNITLKPNESKDYIVRFTLAQNKR